MAGLAWHRLLRLWDEEEEEEEEEEADSSDLFPPLSWPRSSSTSAVVCSWLVFFCARSVPFLWQAQAARHHCRYAPEGLFSSRSSSFPAVACARLVLLVTLHLTLCFFPCRQAQDRGITAGMDHLVVLCLLCATTGALGLEVQKTAFFWRCCSSPTRSSTSPQRFPTCSWTW